MLGPFSLRGIEIIISYTESRDSLYFDVIENRILKWKILTGIKKVEISYAKLLDYI